MHKAIGSVFERYWLLIATGFVMAGGIFFDYSAIKGTEKGIILLVLAVLLLLLGYVAAAHKEGEERILVLLLLLSFWLRLGYVMRVPFGFSSHDLGAAVSNGSPWYADGHIGYLQYIYQHGCLPKGDPRQLWSYYNPPLFYCVAALFLKAQSAFSLDMGHMMENLQLLTMLFATLAIQTGISVLREFGIRGKALNISAAMLMFHPYFIIGGATLNNDILSVLFTFLAILYTVRWYKNGTAAAIMKIALSIGLGMMTKVSVGLVAVAIAVMFLVKFIKEKQYGRYLAQFAAFVAACIPLGMYWPVRNAVKYGMPLVYMQTVGLNPPLYVGKDLASRLIQFDGKTFLDPFIRINADTDYNIWTCLLKTAVFDECRAPLANTAVINTGCILLYASIALAVWSLAAGIYNDMRNREVDAWLNRFRGLIFLLFLGSYMKFCFQYPVICSMNFRYIVPVLLVLAINIGRYYKDERIGKGLKWLTEAFVLVFCMASYVMYGIIAF